MKRLFVFIPLVLLLIGGFAVYQLLFSAPNPKDPAETTFIVSPKPNDTETITKLQSSGLIRSSWAFNLVRRIKGYGEIPAGGYNLSKNLSVWQVAYELTSQSPDYIWITIPEGLRKEQIGERFAQSLGWTDSELADWNTVYTRMQYDYREGVYFPDTYLVGANEKNFEVAARLTARFNEVFAPYMTEFAAQDILWTTGLKVASLIERETADPADMPIISAVIWNRLLSDMRLQIDATLQYAKGKVGDKWWAPVSANDKYIDSPYNTYLNSGLPPTPICNPGLAAIKAALNPADTDCLFYLHDSTGLMHCATTYEEHLANIDQFLR